MTDDEIRVEALAVRDAHDPAQQVDNGYERCALCHYTRHPCDAYDMADTVLRLLDRTTAAAPVDPRIALRPYTVEGGKAHGPTTAGEPLDDVYVRGVTMFRLEDMGDWIWMCCYLDDGGSRIAFHIRRGGPREPRVVVTATECPSLTSSGEVVTYESVD